MEVIGFYGPPGTGKSDRALVIAYENKASCIIDDGILIYHSRIVAQIGWNINDSADIEPDAWHPGRPKKRLSPRSEIVICRRSSTPLRLPPVV